MLKLNNTHYFLVAGPDFESCRNRVLRFFQRTLLVHYDSVTVIREKSLVSENPLFWANTEKNIDENQRVLQELINDLEGSGLHSLRDFVSLPEGFQSKTLHIVAHLLDGFFGIDSHFFNLEEDSHRISRQLNEKIRKTPSWYWLICAEACSESPEKASFIHSVGSKSTTIA
ncbi:MAG: hypothetical protein KKE17_05205 [Proteobacteria bacterium]|nr:hypothetical protein [Pseudomonadota bacterium]MBU1709387.1 hypothetical protein [Pseudomonadota bacterium]